MDNKQQNQSTVRTQEQGSSLQDRAMLSGFLGLVTLALVWAALAPSIA